MVQLRISLKSIMAELAFEENVFERDENFYHISFYICRVLAELEKKRKIS